MSIVEISLGMVLRSYYTILPNQNIYRTGWSHHGKGSSTPLKISHLYLSDYVVSIRLQWLLNGISVGILGEPFQTGFRSELNAILFPHSAVAHVQKPQAPNSCPPHTLLGYVKRLQLTWDHLAFPLTHLLRTSRNLDCPETPGLQNKTHNMVNSNRSTKSNPMLTGKIMLLL